MLRFRKLEQVREDFTRKSQIYMQQQLIMIRIIVLRAANKLTDDTDMTKVEQESYTYYKSALYEKYGFVKMKDEMELME